MRGAALCLMLCVLSSAHHRVSGFDVALRRPTLNPDGTVSVSCEHNSGDALAQYDTKLMSEGQIKCQDKMAGCRTEKEGYQKVTFTLWALQARDADRLYLCKVTRMSEQSFPPITSKDSKETTLFQDCRIPFPPPRASNSSTPPPTYAPPSTAPVSVAGSSGPLSSPVDPLLWVLAAACGLLALYALTITLLLIRLKVSRQEVLYDTLTYVPVQHLQTRPQGQVVRGVRDPSEEYMDMREVQNKSRMPRDLNYNSQHAFTNGIAA
ncbi:uncharacterized protein si:ch211-67e16.3 [Engraulis encrasicolus]|uniref:uncharacterized protein si:ch211-67e16.3 n=1 Tax=Engraulis encrasicolus TaxID=184585 RepID=UPI002FD3A28E